MMLPGGLWSAWARSNPILGLLDVKKLKGRPAWRVRVGDYRILYEIHDRELVVIVVTIGHRREVYR
jgi:mRNA-degrading endonuclease RelE of RelBE toxin-antitoxin system